MLTPLHKSFARLVAMRHGQSTSNLDNTYAGWSDVKLTPTGVEDAQKAACLLRDNGFLPQVVFTSKLTRSIRTFNLLAEVLDCHHVEVHKCWQLNQRSYGALQGLSKKETQEKYGKEQVRLWRRGYDVLPPALSPDDPRSPLNDPRYANVPRELLPLTQSFKQCYQRVARLWKQRISGQLLLGRDVLVVGHGTSLRSLDCAMTGKSVDQARQQNIPNGSPKLYQLSADLTLLSNRFLQTESVMRQKIEALQNKFK